MRGIFNNLERFSAMPKANQLTPIDQEVRKYLPTSEASIHLNRAQQTLRIWAMNASGPIHPVRINGRLAWPVSVLKELLAEA
jgi:hypothetical protein